MLNVLTIDSDVLSVHFIFTALELEFDFTPSVLKKLQHKEQKKSLYFTTKDAGAPTANTVAVKFIYCCISEYCKIFYVWGMLRCYCLRGAHYRKK